MAGAAFGHYYNFVDCNNSNISDRQNDGLLKTAMLAMHRLLSVIALALLPFGAQAFAQTRTTSPTTPPLAQAAELRSLSQRLAKLHLQLRLNLNAEAAQRQIDQGVARFDAALTNLRQTPLQGPAATTFKRVDAVWQEQKQLMTAAPNATSAERVILSAEELTIAAGRLAMQLEGAEESPVWRLSDLAGRNNMLAQRLARLYLQTRLGDKSQGRRVDIETTRKEFVTSLDELTRAPQTSPAVADSLKLARQQWIFFDAAIGPDGGDANAARHVATTSERIGEMMDAIGNSYARQAAEKPAR